MEREPSSKASRERRFRWYPGVAAVGAVGVLIALVLTVAPGLDGWPGQGEIDGPLGHPDEGEIDDPPKDPNNTDAALDVDPIELSIPARVSAMWPFERPRMVLFGGAEAEADDLKALAAEIAARDDVAQARRLDAEVVRARAGETQAERLLAEGVGAVVADVSGGAAARTTAHAILSSGDGSSEERVAQVRGERPRVAGVAIRGVLVPDCKTLAHSAGLVGVEAARALIDAVDCHEPAHVIAAGPDAREPWVAISDDHPPEPAAGKEGADGDRSPATGAEWDACLHVLSVHAKSHRGCAGDSDNFGGLTGLGWDRRPPVLAGVAPQGSLQVTANGQTLAAAGQAGEVRLFAGAIAPDGRRVTLRALDGDQQVLAEREITRSELVATRPDTGEPGPEGPAGPANAAPQLRASRLQLAWAFDGPATAVMTLAPSHAGTPVETIMAEIAARESVVDVERVDRAQRRGEPGQAASGAAGDRETSEVVLVVTASSREAARSLTSLAQRHGIAGVQPPTCGALAGSAMFHGSQHAEALLTEAACGEVTILGAGATGAARWVAAATVAANGEVCMLRAAVHNPADISCDPPPSGSTLSRSASSLGPDHATALVTGVAPAAAATVEIDAGDTTVTVEATSLGQASVFAGTVRADLQQLDAVRVLDADDQVLVQQRAERLQEGGEP